MSPLESSDGHLTPTSELLSWSLSSSQLSDDSFFNLFLIHNGNP